MSAWKEQKLGKLKNDMQAKFAKAIAANIRIIAEETARIALMDYGKKGPMVMETVYAKARVEACRAIEKAEQNIAALLQQPGTWTSNKKS